MAYIHSSKNIRKILDKINFSKLGKKIAIKVHFGEKGCKTFINPEIVRKVYNRVTNEGKEATLVECNVLYKGSRTNSSSHIKTAREHGFDMPIDILDGEDGSEFIDVDGCKIGKGIEKYDSLIVVSHFKGHVASGFGGALKNVGMGLGSRAGKLDMHSNIKPTIGSDCIGCGICVENCNADAIIISDGKARIDHDRCEGCAMCIAVCDNDSVQIPWAGRTRDELQKRIAEYTKAVLSLFPDAIFINVLENITKECDCMGIEQEPIMDDIGILSSEDIVAIDKASLDLADRYSNGSFLKINTVNKENQIKFAEEQCIGSSEYEIIEI